MSAWNAIFAPKGTPHEVVAKLSDALVKALDDDDHARSASSTSAPSSPTGEDAGPPALQKLVESEVARWTPVLKAAGAAAP